MEKKTSSSIIGILSKSLKTTYRNGKLLLSIMLFVYLYISFIELCGDVVMKPAQEGLSHKPSQIEPQQIALEDLSHKYSSQIEPKPIKDLSDFDEATLKDVKIFLVVSFITLILSCTALFFSSICTISSSSAAHTAKILTLKGMLLWVRKRWVGVFKTTIYMGLISMAVFSVYFFVLVIGSILLHGLWSYSLKVGASCLLGFVCYICVSVVWTMTLVVSVVEDKCSGLKAIDRAGEILKGKRLKACAIMVLFSIVGIAIYMSPNLIQGKLWTNKWFRMGVRSYTIWSIGLVKLFLLVVFTVFYHECKNGEKDGEEEEEEIMKEKLGLYLPIASGDHA